jgi:hypothetical protein
MSTKLCPGCPDVGEQLLENFYKNKRNKDGRQTRCIKCQLAYQAGHRGEAKERTQQWRESNTSSRRTRGFVRGGPGTLFLTLED